MWNLFKGRPEDQEAYQQKPERDWASFIVWNKVNSGLNLVT